MTVLDSAKVAITLRVMWHRMGSCAPSQKASCAIVAAANPQLPHAEREGYFVVPRSAILLPKMGALECRLKFGKMAPSSSDGWPVCSPLLDHMTDAERLGPAFPTE